MAESLSETSQYAREQMVRELAADAVFQTYEHDVDEIAQVVAGLAYTAAMPEVEYVATPEDVGAVAELVAFSLGLQNYQEAGASAQAQFSQLHLARAS